MFVNLCITHGDEQEYKYTIETDPQDSTACPLRLKLSISKDFNIQDPKNQDLFLERIEHFFSFFKINHSTLKFNLIIFTTGINPHEFEAKAFSRLTSILEKENMVVWCDNLMKYEQRLASINSHSKQSPPMPEVLAAITLSSIKEPLVAYDAGDEIALSSDEKAIASARKQMTMDMDTENPSSTKRKNLMSEVSDLGVDIDTLTHLKKQDFKSLCDKKGLTEEQFVSLNKERGRAKNRIYQKNHRSKIQKALSMVDENPPIITVNTPNQIELAILKQEIIRLNKENDYLKEQLHLTMFKAAADAYQNSATYSNLASLSMFAQPQQSMLAPFSLAAWVGAAPPSDGGHAQETALRANLP